MFGVLGEVLLGKTVFLIVQPTHFIVYYFVIISVKKIIPFRFHGNCVHLGSCT